MLVAIAIPVFTTQLEKSKESTDMANLRSAYAAGAVAALTQQVGADTLNESTTYYYNPSADGSLSTAGATLGQGTQTDGKADTSSLPGLCHYSTTQSVKGNKIQVSFGSGSLSSVDFVA